MVPCNIPTLDREIPVRIRKRLQISAIPAIAVSLVAALFISLGWQQQGNTREQRRKAQMVVKGVFNLNSIAYEYTMTRSLDDVNDWYQESQRLEKILESYEPANDNEERLLLEARASHMRILDHFRKLSDTAPIGPRHDARFDRLWERRNASEFLRECRSMLRMGFELAASAEARDRAASRRTNALVVVSILVLVGVIAVGAVWMASTVVDRVDAVHKGMEIVATGNLDHRIEMEGDDEFGDLARAFDDMTERLQTSQAELQRSNKALEEYAYVASHDLSEPLRMVSSFLQLLERRYRANLDQKAHEYIDFAVDGAKRMQVLIKDLLHYSRVGMSNTPFERVDCNKLVAQVWQDLNVAVEESHAELSCGDLPAIHGDRLQLQQLFQNIIANGIKFHGETAPYISVRAVIDGEQARFTIADNGIGIDPDHATRIFVIFQRLHTREQYSGTGIGLAVCKKIVDRHGGEIWVESAEGSGSRFCFTLPLAC
jgi:signal transduction histidine kinase